MKKILLILSVVALVTFACVSCGGTDVPTTEDINKDYVIYENDTLKAVYKGISDMSGIIVMTVSLENKSDEEITVLPLDSSVDDTMVLFTSGMMATIQGGKKFDQGWIIGSQPTDNIEFSMGVYDEHMVELFNTGNIRIDVE